MVRLTRSPTGPILQSLRSVPVPTRSGIATAALSTSACLEEGQRPTQIAGIRPKAFTHVSKVTPADVAVATQFCVYVADRLVLPILSQGDITAIASGRFA